MNSELVEHEIRIGDIVYYLDKWKWFVIGLTILAGVGATYFALRYTEQTFHADALMVLTAKNSSGLYNNNEMEPGNTDFLYAQNLVDSVVALVNSDKVVKALVEQVGLDINPQQMCIRDRNIRCLALPLWIQPKPCSWSCSLFGKGRKQNQ